MRNILINIILLVFIAGCSPRIFSGMEPGAKESVLKENLYPFFTSRDSAYVFNMLISYKENDYAGTLIVKHAADKMTRVVYTSVFGVIVFDFEFNEADFKVNRCIEPLQKKVVLNLFKKDFRTLFLYCIQPTFNAKVYTGNNSKVGYKARTCDGKAYYLTDVENKVLQKIQVPGCFTLLEISCAEFDRHFPKHISLVHPRIKLKMELEAVN